MSQSKGLNTAFRVKNIVSIEEPQFGAVDGAADNSTPIQACINAINTAGGGWAYAGPGTWKCNVTMKSHVKIQGAGSVTKFQPVNDDHVFTTTADGATSTVRIGWHDLQIVGDVTKTSQDGIHLEATGLGTFVDDVEINRVQISNCGRYGIRAKGTSSSGPHCQRVKIIDTQVATCVDSGVSFEGAIFSPYMQGCFIQNNGGSSAGANNPNCEFINNATYLEGPSQSVVINCAFSHSSAVTAGSNDATALLIDSCRDFTCIGNDFEEADPHIKLSSVNGNDPCGVIIIANHFAAGSADIDRFIEIQRARGLDIGANDFIAGNAHTVAAAIKFNRSAISAVVNWRIHPTNNFSGTFTNGTIDFSDLLELQGISAGTAKAYGPVLRLDCEGAAANDDLDSIFDENGGTTRLMHGQEVTIWQHNSSDDIRVRHNTGNILLKSGLDYCMTDNTCYLHLMWDQLKTKWIEKGRKDNLGLPTQNLGANGYTGGGAEQQLKALALAASFMLSTGMGVKIRAWGTTANNANAKDVKLYFGSTVILDVTLTISVAGKWVLEGIVQNVGASSQRYSAIGHDADNTKPTIADSTCTETDTASITVKVTATATTNNDVICNGLRVEQL